jgi:hypothetical protein
MTPAGAAVPSRRRAVAFALAVLATLLFTWPFVRLPQLRLVPAYLHLLGAWLLVVAALAVVARSLRPPRPRTGRHD